MKKSVKWILMALVSIGIFVCVFVAYNNLKEEYNPNSFSEVSETATEHAADSESVAAPDFTVYDENGNLSSEMLQIYGDYKEGYL